MKAEIENQIKSLDKAYKAKLISTDEYCSQLTPLLKKLNSL